MISFFFVLISFAQPLLFASTPEVEIPTIITEGSPLDALGDDAIMPSQGGRARGTSGTGAVSGGIRDRLPISVSDLGAPGTYSALVGLGRSSEENDVQAVGVPLNFPQGGGFDLSIFPQFLWSSYRYRVGPSAQSFDPRGVAGTMTLVPWTQEALLQPQSRIRFTQLVSNFGMSQTSVGAQAGDRVAVLAGYSEGNARGPSMALSGRWGSGKVSGKYHLLGTHLDVATKGSRSFPTPRARQLTFRVIPVFQTDVKFESGTLLKTSVFYDASYLKAQNPDFDFVSRDRMQQLGAESALLVGDWKIGANVRRLTYRQTSIEVPSESIANLHLSRILENDDWTIEPIFQAVNVSRVGTRPVGSLGVRRELGAGDLKPAVFSRVGLNHRFPSLVDRYYVVPGFFTGNPALKTERVWTATVGAEVATQAWDTCLQIHSQLREDAQIALGVPSPINAGLARVNAAIHSLSVRPTGWLELSHGLTVSQSRLDQTGLPFPYVPRLLEAVSLRLGPQEFWHLESVVRGAEGRHSALGQKLPGYGWMDLGGSYQATRDISLTARIENVFDRNVELIEGYPAQKRALFLAFQGQF